MIYKVIKEKLKLVILENMHNWIYRESRDEPLPFFIVI